MNRLSVESYRVVTPPMCWSAPKAGDLGHLGINSDWRREFPRIGAE